MGLEDKLTVLKNIEELIKDSKRLDWLIKLTQHTGVFDSADMKLLGVHDGNFRKFIDIAMKIPMEEILSDMEQEG